MTMVIERRTTTKVFISYCWEDEEHQAWVGGLARDLRGHGIDVAIDQSDVTPGMDVPAYMEKSLRDADHVLLVCTPDFAAKADAGTGGVGYEKDLVAAAIYTGESRSAKFVPLLRRGDPAHSVPLFLRGLAYLDVRTADQYAMCLERLLQLMRAADNGPAAGERPVSRSNGRAAERVVAPSGAGTGNHVFCCRRCGAILGQPTFCPGHNSHDFVPGDATFYCRRCGHGIGIPKPCIGHRAHDFRPFGRRP